MNEETKTVWKFSLPIDDRWHVIEGLEECAPEILGVESTTSLPEAVSFWLERIPGHVGPPSRRFRVFGTGHQIPEGTVHRGIAVMNGYLIWHLYEDVSAGLLEGKTAP